MRNKIDTTKYLVPIIYNYFSEPNCQTPVLLTLLYSLNERAVTSMFIAKKIKKGERFGFTPLLLRTIIVNLPYYNGKY